MVQQYGIMSSPGIIVNGELFSVGGLNNGNMLADEDFCPKCGSPSPAYRAFIHSDMVKNSEIPLGV